MSSNGDSNDQDDDSGDDDTDFVKNEYSLSDEDDREFVDNVDESVEYVGTIKNSFLD